MASSKSYSWWHRSSQVTRLILIVAMPTTASTPAIESLLERLT
jgi:hypothetical protein